MTGAKAGADHYIIMTISHDPRKGIALESRYYFVRIALLPDKSQLELGRRRAHGLMGGDLY